MKKSENSNTENNNMNASNSNDGSLFNVVQGDLPISPGLAGGDFLGAQATNTRLMGVIGLHIIRKNDRGVFHQLLYLDYEEFGIDEYRGYQVNDYANILSAQEYEEIVQELDRDLADMFGGLGGEWIEVTEVEAINLVQDAFRLNDFYDIDLPSLEDEFLCIINAPIKLTDQEKKALWKKVSVETENDYEVINYFIMRAAAMDDPGINYLSAPEAEVDLFIMDDPGTLFRNEIEELDDSHSQGGPSLIHEYKATSLISDDIGFRLLVSEITVAGPWVIKYYIKEDMRITGWESSLIMARDEYVFLSNANGENAALALSLAVKSRYNNSELHPHDAGNLFMIFRKDNKHVANKVYRLDDDIIVSIYIKFDGEILIAGKDIDEVHHYEGVLNLMASAYSYSITDMGRFVFQEATLGRYVNDDYGEFDSFLDFIQYLTTRE